jgi:hypothetical protein
MCQLKIVFVGFEVLTAVVMRKSILWIITLLSSKKLCLYRLWRPLGLREVEAPIFSDIRLTDGGKVVRPTCRLLFTPRKIPGTNFC